LPTKIIMHVGLDYYAQCEEKMNRAAKQAGRRLRILSRTEESGVVSKCNYVA